MGHPRMTDPRSSPAMSRSERYPDAGVAYLTRLGHAGTLRRLPDELAAVLPGRNVEPALAGTEEAALVVEAEQVGRLGQRELETAEILLGELAACVVQQLHKRGRFILQAPLQRALAHAQLSGDLVAPRFAVRQPADDHLPRPIADQGAIEMPEVVAGEALVQLGEYRVRRGERRGQVGIGKQQAVARRVEQYRAAKGRSVGRGIRRRGVRQFDGQW